MLICSIVNGQWSSVETTEPFDDEADILVAGLGTAGAMAAIVAAEAGLRVLAVERTTGMGGMGTMGCVWDYYYGSPGGRYEAINQQSLELLHQGYAASDIDQEGRCIPGAAKCLILEQNARQAGCRILYETIVTGLYLDGRQVIGVRVLHQGESRRFRTAVVIDSTGEAALCRLAGCRLHGGRIWDGKRPMISKTAGLLQQGYSRGAWGMSTYADIHDAAALTAKILSFADLPFYLPDFCDGQKRLICDGAILGIRETCSIEAMVNLSFAGLMAGERAREPLFYAFSPLDNVNRDVAFESMALQDWHLIAELHDFGFSVGIPAEALIPNDFDGIIVAGKGIGIDHDLAASARMKKDMEKCGEAAAVLAILAVRRHCLPRQVPYADLKQLLESSGCLNTDDDVILGDLNHKTGSRWQPVHLLHDPEDMRAGLAADDARVAFWSIRQGGAQWLPWLARWRQDPDGTLADNSAIAAGLLGDASASRELRKIVTNVPSGGSMQVRRFPKACKAICLLGRLGDSEAVDLLFAILGDNAAEVSKSYVLGQAYQTQQDYAFQFITLTIRSLLDIANKQPGQRARISHEMLKWAQMPGYSLVTSLGQTEVGPALQQMVLGRFK